MAAPIAPVMRVMRAMSMPTITAASLFCATARMARPLSVRRRKAARARKAIRPTAAISRRCPNNRMPPTSKVRASSGASSSRGLAPNTSRAPFCRTTESANVARITDSNGRFKVGMKAISASRTPAIAIAASVRTQAPQ